MASTMHDVYVLNKDDGDNTYVHMGSKSMGAAKLLTDIGFRWAFSVRTWGFGETYGENKGKIFSSEKYLYCEPDVDRIIRLTRIDDGTEKKLKKLYKIHSKGRKIWWRYYGAE